jgi:hypothetical protein
MSAPTVWALRVAWVTLPLTSGPLFAAALDPTRDTFRTVASLGLWGAWAVGLLATLVPHVLTLTVVRILLPAAVPAAVWAAVVADDASTAAVVVGLVAATVAALLSLAPGVGARFVDGSSYGDERRLPLRAPTLVAVALVPPVWALTVAGLVTGPLLLADRRWVLGGILTAAGWALAAVLARSLHQLSRRWLVFVPAGVVVHDLLALREPVLFPMTSLVALGPAPAGTAATDLTLAAAGTPLRLALGMPVTVTTGAGFGRRAGQELRLDELLVAPTLPGRATAIAAERGLPVG